MELMEGQANMLREQLGGLTKQVNEGEMDLNKFKTMLRTEKKKVEDE